MSNESNNLNEIFSSLDVPSPQSANPRPKTRFVIEMGSNESYLLAQECLRKIVKLSKKNAATQLVAAMQMYLTYLEQIDQNPTSEEE